MARCLPNTKWHLSKLLDYISALSQNPKTKDCSRSVVLCVFLLIWPLQIRSASHFYRTQVWSFTCLVSPSLTDCCCWDLTDVALACEDVRVAADYFMERSPFLWLNLAKPNLLVQILKLKFCPDYEAEFGQDFENEFHSSSSSRMCVRVASDHQTSYLSFFFQVWTLL